MKIKISAIGKIKQQFVLAGEEEYLQRLKPLCNLTIQELEAKTSLPPDKMKKEEFQATINKLSHQEVLIVLDEHGKDLTSAGLANWLQSEMNSGTSQFCFAIGGSFGWDPEIKKHAKLVLALSKLTLPYQICRLVLVEQIYRALTIIKGIPYHK